jgi:hypothetical protein
VILAPAADLPDVPIPALADAAGQFRAACDATGGCGYLVRPDGYVGYRAAQIAMPRLAGHLARIFAT